MCGIAEKWALTIFHCPPCLIKTRVVLPWMVNASTILGCAQEHVVSIYDSHCVVVDTA